MALILLTGMSGTGKSAALEALRERGYSTVDTDYGDWIAELPLPDGSGTERQWQPEKLTALLEDHERAGTPLFVAGTVYNQVDFYPRFDEVVLLSASLPVLLERIAARTGNPFGKTSAQREQIVADTAEIEPLLREAATLEIDTARPLAEVVDRLAGLAGAPPVRAAQPGR